MRKLSPATAIACVALFFSRRRSRDVQRKQSHGRRRPSHGSRPRHHPTHRSHLPGRRHGGQRRMGRPAHRHQHQLRPTRRNERLGSHRGQPGPRRRDRHGRSRLRVLDGHKWPRHGRRGPSGGTPISDPPTSPRAGRGSELRSLPVKGTSASYSASSSSNAISAYGVLRSRLNMYLPE